MWYPGKLSASIELDATLSPLSVYLIAPHGKPTLKTFDLFSSNQTGLNVLLFTFLSVFALLKDYKNRNLLLFHKCENKLSFWKLSRAQRVCTSKNVAWVYCKNRKSARLRPRLLAGLALMVVHFIYVRV